MPEIERLTATNQGIAPLELEQIFSSRCHAEQAKGQNLPQTFFRWMKSLGRPPLEGKAGGAGRDRTDDPLLAKQVLSQLSYGPVSSVPSQAQEYHRDR